MKQKEHPFRRHHEADVTHLCPVHLRRTQHIERMRQDDHRDPSHDISKPLIQAGRSTSTSEDWGRGKK